VSGGSAQPHGGLRGVVAAAALAVLAAGSAVVAVAPPQPPRQPTGERVVLDSGRSYVLHVPPQAREDPEVVAGRPVMVVLHGLRTGPADIATSTGFARQFFPIGSMSNKGVELLLRTTNVDRPRLTWTTTATYARNRNRVERLSIQDFQSAAAYPNRIRAGEPAGVFYGSYAARDCVTGALLLDSLGRYRRSNQTVDMGATLAQRQAISRGTCNDSLNKVIGDPNPNFLASLFNEFTVMRKLRVRALLDGTFGNDVMNLSTRAQNAGIASNSKEYERELLPYGDPRKLAPGFNARTQGVFEYWVEDGSFVKLREVSATYTLDVPAVRRAFRDGVELTVSGRNLAVWTNYSGYDPELNLFGTNAGGLNASQTTAADRGFDFGGYPIPRVWSASARFTF